MQVELPTQKLSPKNQVTLPKGARALIAAESDGHVCGLLHRMQQGRSGVWYPTLVLLVESELQRREDAIRAAAGADPLAAEAAIARLNGTVQRMAIDAQRRVVLPKHFVAHLKLGHEVYMFSTNSTVLAWNPTDWLAWSAAEEEQAPSGPPLLMI